MSDIITAPSDLAAITDHSFSWDWENKHVSQSYTDHTTSLDTSIYNIIESGTVLIVAGPASWEGAITNSGNGVSSGAVRLVPIGLVETATVAMSKPLSRIFEIGSKLSYIITGRTVGEIALARVMFDGPSLLKVLYKGEVLSDSQVPASTGGVISKSVNFASSKGQIDNVQLIGSGNIAMNLASKFFDQPCGLGFFFKDRESDMVSQIYFEGCRISTYNIGIAANMNVLTESVRMEFVQCFPIVANVSSISREVRADKQIVDIPIIGATALSTPPTA